jgi:hypothetical protein
MQAEVDQAGLDFVMLPALAALMDQAIARGDGNADWTVVAKDLV